MERKKALALAAAVTTVLGSASVAVAAVGGISLLGFGDGHHAAVSVVEPGQPRAAGGSQLITRIKDVYDRVIVGGSASPKQPGSVGLVSVVPTTAPAPASSVPPKVGTRSPGAGKHHRRKPAPKVSPRPSNAIAPTTSTTRPSAPAAPTTTTTTASSPVTTTTLPPGVPADWPPGKPIPPMPPNCRHPQLEDNGVWNCDD